MQNVSESFFRCCPVPIPTLQSHSCQARVLGTPKALSQHLSAPPAATTRRGVWTNVGPAPLDQTRHAEDLGATFSDKEQEGGNQHMPGPSLNIWSREPSKPKGWGTLLIPGHDWRNGGWGSLAKACSSDLLSRSFLSLNHSAPALPAPESGSRQMPSYWNLGALPDKHSPRA